MDVRIVGDLCIRYHREDKGQGACEFVVSCRKCKRVLLVKTEHSDIDESRSLMNLIRLHHCWQAGEPVPYSPLIEDSVP